MALYAKAAALTPKGPVNLLTCTCGRMLAERSGENFIIPSVTSSSRRGFGLVNQSDLSLPRASLRAGGQKPALVVSRSGDLRVNVHFVSDMQRVPLMHQHYQLSPCHPCHLASKDWHGTVQLRALLVMCRLGRSRALQASCTSSSLQPRSDWVLLTLR